MNLVYFFVMGVASSAYLAKILYHEDKHCEVVVLEPNVIHRLIGGNQTVIVEASSLSSNF